MFEMNAANLRTWLRDPPGVKPGSKMPDLNLSSEEITNLVAYLQTLK
jgi:cytochrome c1